MTPPKYVVPGQVVMATRRCSERRYFLLPAPWLDEAFGYLVALYAERYFVGVHVAKVLGNHWHIVFTDYLGLRSRFLQTVHAGVARVVNDRMGRRGRVWDNQEPGDCVLCDAPTILEKTLYVATNAVRHGIVRERKAWAGLALGPEAWGVPQTYRRPKVFTRLPRTASLKTRAPFQILAMAHEAGAHTHDEIRAWASAKCDERQAELVAQREADGKGFLSMLRVRKMKRTDAPNTDDGRGRLNPRFAAKDGPARRAALLRLRRFRKRYRRARKRWLAGDTAVIFPRGTYWYRHFSPATTAADAGQASSSP